MFARPRAKKSVLPQPSKKKKVQPTIEEINFDNDARADYLTGFHKRKVQRQKHAQEIATKKAREEKILERKQVCIYHLEIMAAHNANCSSKSCERSASSRSRSMCPQ